MKTTFEIVNTTQNGMAAVELVILGATSIPGLDALTTSLGYMPTLGVSNRRSIVCAYPESIDAACIPLEPFFDKSWRGLKTTLRPLNRQGRE